MTTTGSNAPATGPDCPFLAGDPLWWEAFFIDDCAMVRIDTCCTAPPFVPVWDCLLTSCPCVPGDLVAASANPFRFREPRLGFGDPYCPGEDNFWLSFGPLAAGTYYYPVYSRGCDIPPAIGSCGDYQMHITVEACPRAACCLGEVCEDGLGDGLTQLECDALGGFWLAPPNLTPGITPCAGTDGEPGSTCYFGSCCTADGCVDDLLGSRMTSGTCAGLGGTYVGGVRCQGGFCLADPLESCASDLDCAPGDDCIGDAEQLAQRSPCDPPDPPITECRVTAPPPPMPLGDPSGLNKSRFISFGSPAAATAGVAELALRVTLNSLHVVIPPYTGGPSIPFVLFEGEQRWVGPPGEYLESSAGGIPFFAAQLECVPYYEDWAGLGLLHVTGSAIVPSSSYEVQSVSIVCEGVEDMCGAVSAPLTINTTRWGDVTTPYNPPSPTIQPDITDVSALVDKFRSAPGAPIKARSLLAGEPGNPFGEITDTVLSVDFGFSHISACVDAFRGLPYPYGIEACPP